MGFKLSGTGGSLKFNKDQNYVEGMGLKVKVPPPPPPLMGTSTNPIPLTLGVPYNFTIDEQVVALHATSVDWDSCSQSHYGRYFKFTVPETTGSIGVKFGIQVDDPTETSSIDTILFLFSGSTYDGVSAPIAESDDDGYGNYSIFPNSFARQNLLPGEYIVETSTYVGGPVLSNSTTANVKILVEDLPYPAAQVPSGSISINGTLVETWPDFDMNNVSVGSTILGTNYYWYYAGIIPSGPLANVPVFYLSDGPGSPTSLFGVGEGATTMSVTSSIDIDTASGSPFGMIVSNNYNTLPHATVDELLISGNYTFEDNYYSPTALSGTLEVKSNMTLTLSGCTVGTRFFAYGTSAYLPLFLVGVLPASIPGAPTGLSSTDSWNNSYGASQVDLSWSAPSSDGGSPITSYNIYLDGYGLFDTVTMPGSLSYTMPQYTPTLPYSFTVTAVNAVGESAQSSAATGVGFLEAPPEPTITAASWIDLVDPGKAEVTFDVDPAHPVASITLYNASDDSLVYSDPFFGDDTSSVGLGNSFQLSGMSEGSPTSLYLVLSNSSGLSPTGSFTLIARPATPSNFAYTWAGTLNDDITFSWDAVPGADYYQLYDTVSFNNSTVYGTSHVFPSPLEPETEYTFTLWTVVGGSVSLQTSSIITTGAT